MMLVKSERTRLSNAIWRSWYLQGKDALVPGVCGSEGWGGVRVSAVGSDRTHPFYWIHHVLLFIGISLLEPAHLSPPTHSDQGASSPVLQLQCDPPGSGPEPQGAPGEEDPCLATTQRSQTEFLVLSKVLHRIVCVGGGGTMSLGVLTVFLCLPCSLSHVGSCAGR